MFKSPFQYFRCVFKMALAQTVKWNGTVAIGLFIGFCLTVLEMKEGSPTLSHLIRDYAGVLLLIYVVQLARSFWRAHLDSNLCAEDIWELKKQLREIARRFPGNPFVKRPTDRGNWSPLIGQPETGIQGTALDLALTWHDKFKKLFPSCSGMTWDETIAFLDYEERRRRGLPL